MKHLASIIGLLSLLVFAAPANAQDNDITNEYRATLVTSKPVGDKVVLFTYLGDVNSPEKRQDALLFVAWRDLQTKTMDGSVRGIIRRLQQ